MKLLTSLLPLAIAVAAVGAVTWFLLTRGWGLGPWLLAVLLLAHGFVHLVFLFPQPEPAAATAGGLAYPFDMDRSWLISGVGLDGGLVRTAGIGLMAVVFGLSALAALATVGLLVPAGWWAPLVVASALGSMLLLTVFFSPLFVIGYAIDLALLWLVIGSVWRPAGA